MTPQVIKLRKRKSIQIYIQSGDHVLSDKTHYGRGGLPTIVKGSLIAKKPNARKNTLNNISSQSVCLRRSSRQGIKENSPYIGNKVPNSESREGVMKVTPHPPGSATVKKTMSDRLGSITDST